MTPHDVASWPFSDKLCSDSQEQATYPLPLRRKPGGSPGDSADKTENQEPWFLGPSALPSQMQAVSSLPCPPSPLQHGSGPSGM